MLRAAEHRSRVLPLLRALFLVAVVAFAWLGLRGRFHEVRDALADTSAIGVGGALVLVLFGLIATGVLWLRLMAAVGAELTLREGLATFFIGQLGKYIPGSVWSIGAQAHMAGRQAVPARATVAAGLLFLGYHVATAIAVGMLSLLVGDLNSPWPEWVSVLALVTAVLGMLPPVVRLAGRRIGGREPAIGPRDTVIALCLMAVTWTAYAAALVLLSPDQLWRHLIPLAGAFALAYALGVVIIVAPAGFGAREALFVVLLTPLLGVAPATAVALLARVVHTAADSAMAAVWWYVARLAASSPR